MTSSTSARPLDGLHALVAGAGGPHARPAAVALAEAGATVSLFTQADDRAQEVEAQSILNECWSLGRDGEVVRLDATDAAHLAAALDAIEAKHGPVSVLVTVPPAPQPHAEEAFDGGAWDAEFRRSATSTVMPVLSAGRRMLVRGSGRVVNVVSALHEGTSRELAAYAAAQSAVLAFTRSLAQDWDSRGVLVRALVSPEPEHASGPHANESFRTLLRATLEGAS
ncbi:MAG: SDR family NAD(P)-dependent oxidoreductase [Dehalococcoidia bacterium]